MAKRAERKRTTSNKRIYPTTNPSCYRHLPTIAIFQSSVLATKSHRNLENQVRMVLTHCSAQYSSSVLCMRSLSNLTLKQSHLTKRRRTALELDHRTVTAIVTCLQRDTKTTIFDPLAKPLNGSNICYCMFLSRDPQRRPASAQLGDRRGKSGWTNKTVLTYDEVGSA